VFETAIGRIGMLLCWDIWFPEVPRLLAQQGAGHHLLGQRLGMDPAPAV